jgi:hypothetical protein
MTPVPWRFGSGALGVDVTVYVTGDPQWQRPARARKADDPNGGPPTLITRGDPLAKRTLPIVMYVPWGVDLEARLNVIRNAYEQRGPYVLYTHREILNVIFDTSQGLGEQDFSGYFMLSATLAEV